MQTCERVLTDSVDEQQAVVGVLGASLRATLAGVATARRGRARAEKAARRENMVAERGLRVAKDTEERLEERTTS